MVCEPYFFPIAHSRFSEWFFFLIKKIDLMVPAAKKAHPPKYKLFGGMSESDSFF